EGRGYARKYSAAKVLRESLSPDEARIRHQSLAQYCVSTDKPMLHLVYHLRHAGAQQLALDYLLTELEARRDDDGLELFASSQIAPDQTAAMLAGSAD